MTSTTVILETGNGPMQITTVGDLQRVQRPGHLDDGDERLALFAIRLRLVHGGKGPARMPEASAQVTADSGACVDADLLVQLDDLVPGDPVEGWLVFELEQGHRPSQIRISEPGGGACRFDLDPAVRAEIRSFPSWLTSTDASA
jgi:hypothetical protein